MKRFDPPLALFATKYVLSALAQAQSELPLLDLQCLQARLSLLRAEIDSLRGQSAAAEPKVRAALAVFESCGDAVGSGDARSLLVSSCSDAADPVRRDATPACCNVWMTTGAAAMRCA